MEPSFEAGSSVNPVSKVELSVSCRNLLDMDVFSKSDPVCVLFAVPGSLSSFIEFGRTEMIKNTLNPDFVKKFVLDYHFEELQKLKFKMYDIDSSSDKLSQHDFLGELECTLGEILGSTNQRLEKPLIGPKKKCGTIMIKAEEMQESKNIMTMRFAGKRLDKKDFLGKSDPFLVFSKCNEDNTYTVVLKTEVKKKTLNPTWQPLAVTVQSICNGDYERPIKIQCYDWDRDGGHDFIGEVTTSFRQLSRGPGDMNTYELINLKKRQKKKNYKNSGVIELILFKVEEVHTFLDYIRGGLQLNFSVAIDFTSSNGNPNNPASLHYIGPNQMNQYAMALYAVGEIIQEYDSDKLFPSFGFGARLPPDGHVSHEFPLNFNPENPFCVGLGGIMESYHQTLRKIQLYGPTNFAPIINHEARQARALPENNYYVLLIITDGIISDMSFTKEAIVQASFLPMSIIIIGVGNADFSAMVELDGDDIRLTSNGVQADRDIVQFVPIHKYIGNHASNDYLHSKSRLAKDVLEELPDQLVSYMKKKGISPKPAPLQQTAPKSTAPPLLAQTSSEL